MFGHESLPALIYEFGGKPPSENLKMVEDLMHQAHRYQNARVHLERKRREKFNRALRAFSPELADLELKIDLLEDKREQARAEINRARASVRKRIPQEDLVKRCKEIGAELKGLNAQKKVLRIPILGSPGWYNEQKKAWEENRPPDPTLTPPDPRWIPVQEALNAWHERKNKLFRKHSGLNNISSTYTLAENAVKMTGRPPKYKTWTGDGHLVVQLQKRKGRSLMCPDVFKILDKRLRIDPLPEGAWRTNENGKIKPVRRLCHTNVRMRIGSDKRQPVWAVIPIMLHRPLPEDAAITFVHLIRRRIGINCEWKVQLSLSRKGGWDKEDAAPGGLVGIDIGWRLLNDGSLRTAYWAGDDDRHGEFVLPADWLKEMRHVEGIQSILDKNFDAIREILSKDLARIQIPDWLKEESRNLIYWKRQAKLYNLVLKWAKNRFPGDEAIYAAAEAWMKRYRHLYDFASNLRDQLQNRRLDIFRNDAAKLRRNYRYHVIENMDLRDFHVLPKPEEEPEDPATRQHTRDACLHLLRKCIEESMVEEPMKAPPENTTKRHHACGSIEEWDHKELMHTCSKCGALYDQDYNAAINLLEYGKSMLMNA